MSRLLVLLIGFSLVACGRHKKDEDEGEDVGDSYVAPYPAGAGTNTRPGASNEEGRPIPQAQPNGSSSGAGPGIPGPTGPQGPAGQSVMLVDHEGNGIGLKLHDDVGSVAQVILGDRRYAMIDRESGDLVPLLAFSCMYESADCSGACFVFDERWLNLVVADQDGATWVADRAAANEGAMAVGSYVGAGGTCVEDSFPTTKSYRAHAYTLPGGLTLPFSAPLYWDISN